MYQIQFGWIEDQLVEHLIFIIIPMAIGIISIQRIERMIDLYRYQTLFLLGLTIFIGILRILGEDNKTGVPLILFALIPGILYRSIRPLLIKTTAGKRVPLIFFVPYFGRHYTTVSLNEHKTARSVWDEHNLSIRQRLTSLFLSIGLITLAYFLAGRIRNPGSDEWARFMLSVVAILLIFYIGRQIMPLKYILFVILLLYTLIVVFLNPKELELVQSLAASVTLLLLGIFTMITRNDLISQIIGLLVMDHGLYLAAMRFAVRSDLSLLIVISLILYILITLMILGFLLPNVLEKSGTIEVAAQSELRG